ncbi:MAG: PHP domain-containing protein [Propionibacteriaceae bacterium]|jgi:predicted metal-dependent phosphoesterase TrpH|nr:PHP domain-containing protein [Propionibacteriaceae bacterium]
MRIDLHTHSFVSDGTDSPAQLVRRAAQLGLDVVALTDHDTWAGVAEARAEAAKVGIDLLGGLEFSCELSGHTVHLLGLGIREDDGALSDETERIRESRLGRVERMAAALSALGMPLSAEEIYAQAEDATTVGRPHVADALVAKGYIENRRVAFDNWLYDGGPAYVPHLRCPLLQGIALIRGAGGVAIIAHPWLRGTADVLTPEVLAELVRSHGLDGFESDHEDHDAAARAELRALAARIGAIPTGSSDYHGVGKVGHDLGVNTTSLASLDEILARIAERGGVGLNRQNV